MLKKVVNRLKRKVRVRSKISWTELRPRLSIYRSNLSIYAQIIDDVTWKTLCSSSDLAIKANWTKSQKATLVWEDIANKAKSINITNVVFDRWGFAYHWRVKALADWAKKWGLQF